PVETTQDDGQLRAFNGVTWLKQHPHWQQRCAERVDEQDDDPDTCGWDTQDGLRQGDWVPIANEHQGVQRDHANNGNQRQVPLQTVDSLANAQGDGDSAPGWDDRRWGGNQQPGDNHTECCVHHEQQQEDDHEEEHAATLADVAPGQKSNGLAAVTLGCPEHAHVMHTGGEDRTDGYPEECWEPAPDNRDGRANNGCCTCNGGEVVSPQDVLVSRNKVHAIFHGVGWSFVAR